RVSTWNLLGAKDPDLSAIAAVLREQQPDAVGLQEVRRSQIRRLAKRLGWHYAWARKHYPYSPVLWWRAEGIGIVSPWQVSARMRTTISPGVSTWIFKHRVLLAATITRRDGRLRVFNTHLASHDADERIAQAKRVADRLRADPERLKIVTADLNTTSDSDVEVLREFRAVGLADPGGNDTEPANAPHQRLDYVLVPFDAHVTLTHTPEGSDLWRALSDHLPVQVAFDAPAG
ncbi:MAG: endonuclease/exonuclease/phosphatase family protein, partial [Ilumatobacteraceae bacterium]